MYIIISMILSGNILLLLFAVLKQLLKGYLNFKTQSCLLKICLVFFTLPLPLVIDLIELLLFKLFGSATEGSLHLKGEIPTIIFTPDYIITNQALHKIIIIFILWLFMACIICGYHFFSYLSFKKFVYSSSEKVHSDSLCTFLEEQSRSLNIKRDINLCQNNYLNSACTIGTIKPIIFLPAACNESNTKFIILHELIHIKNHDTFFRFLCLICKGLYWFNPFIYLLESLLSQTAELVCDDWVSQKMNQESKLSYAYLIIEMSRKKHISSKYPAFLTVNQKTLKERIDCIMKNTKTDKLCKLISTIAAITAVGLSSIPAFASPSTQMINVDTSSPEAVTYYSNVDSYYSPGKPDLAYECPIVYERQFTSIDGKSYDATKVYTEPRVICDHVFTDGTYSRHSLKSDGSCNTKFYDAQRCQNCGSLKIGDFTHELNYRTCPH